ncbi:MAG TPA: HAMP domain-containing sensor histidine kinase [Mycobacteriales bacterium]|jgi:two-component system OmpR family sensor kinase|nr:HAMP domain-containing sensor histidine kinase [Mycobacteriales bacterium]
MRNPLSAIGDRAARTPLRIKLVATVLTLAAAGLSIAAIVATTSLHSYLLGRVDDQLQSAAGFGQRGAGFNGTPPGDIGDQGGPPVVGIRSAQRGLPSEFYFAVYTPAGALVSAREHFLSQESPPKLPRITTAYIASHNGRPFTVSSVNGKSAWRVVARPMPDNVDGVAIATSLADLDHTISHLILIEVLIGGVALLFIGGAGYLVIKQSLRPLVAVEGTAAAIAAGDLTQRVPQLHPRTEVGRLSAALNGMLAQIEGAFTQERTSRRQARASEDRMRQFVADASHELRTPLTSIRGFAELHRMGAATDEADVRRLMQRVEDEASRMGILVEDLLLLARLDEQRPLERKPVDLLEIASDVVHDARIVAPARSIDLQVRTAGPPVVLGDESRLRQVVHNLMTNAVTHTPDATPITLILSTYAGERARAVIEVADAGPGLTGEQASRVFERFYRADTSRSRSAGGTGLGLSIVAGIVAAHGGIVRVESSSEGAVFRVELPLVDAEAWAANDASDDLEESADAVDATSDSAATASVDADPIPT